MTYFGYTKMGNNNAIKFHKNSAPPSGLAATSKEDKSKLVLPPLVHNACVLDRFSNYTDPNFGNRGSKTRYDAFKTKHYRYPTNPTQIYRTPVVESQKYGWHVSKSNAPVQEAFPWAHNPRRKYQSSEMTKFVERMALTNRE